MKIPSSLDCSIWHSFCSFSYNRVYSDHIQLSSDVISCRRKKWERKSTHSPLLIYFFSLSGCVSIQWPRITAPKGYYSSNLSSTVESLEWFSCERFSNNYDVMSAEIKTDEHWRFIFRYTKNKKGREKQLLQPNVQTFFKSQFETTILGTASDCFGKLGLFKVSGPHCFNA